MLATVAYTFRTYCNRGKMTIFVDLIVFIFFKYELFFPTNNLTNGIIIAGQMEFKKNECRLFLI